MATSYGTTWWGKEWLASLTKIDYANRIPRGKSYANTGKVLDLTITDNVISAKVKGHYASSYRITIKVPQVSAKDRTKLMDLILTKPNIMASLSNKILDPELLDIASSLDISIFPKQWRDLDMKCNCPDFAVPCKHIAAVIYMVSMEIDRDPFVLFRMRGIDLLMELKKRKINLDRAEEVSIPKWNELSGFSMQDTPDHRQNEGDSEFESESVFPADVVETSENCSTDLSGETAGNSEEENRLLGLLDRLSFEPVPNLAEDLMNLLPESPAGYVFGSFKNKYGKMLQMAAKKARAVLKNTDIGDDVFRHLRSGVHVFPGISGNNENVIAPGSRIAINVINKTVLKSWSKKRLGYVEKYITPVKKKGVDSVNAVMAYTGHGIVVNHDITDRISGLPGIPGAEEITSFYSTEEEICLRLYYIALKLVVSGAIIPQIIRFEPESGLEVKQSRLIKDESSEAVSCRWIPALLSPDVRSLCTRAGSILKGFSRKIVAVEGDAEPSALFVGSSAIGYFISNIIQDTYFDEFDKTDSEDIVFNLIFDTPGDIVAYNGLLPEYTSLEKWLSSFHLLDGNIVPLISITESTAGDSAVKPGSEGNTETSSGLDDDAVSVYFSLSLSSPNLGNEEVPLAKVMADPACSCYFDVLKLAGRLTSCCPALNALLNAGKERIKLSIKDLEEFLINSLPLLKIIGCRMVMPKNMRKLLKPAVKMRISSSGMPGGSLSFLNLKKVLSYDWEYTAGDLKLSPDDFEKLIDNAGRLVRFKGQYLYFTADDVKNLLKQKKQTEKSVSGNALVLAAITRSFSGIDVLLDDSASSTLNGLFTRRNIEVPATVKAELRPYQVSGFSWLYNNAMLGIGSIIADDMGLGKTLQVITVLESMRLAGELNKARALVVVPKTLLINWQKEINRFAPELRYSVVYGTGAELPQGGHVVITTYGKLRSATELFASMKIRILIIDEAQNIKNASTATRKAVCSLKSDGFIAMSGTPVENRLLEYWSIMDFANPGLLGTASSFNKAYAVPIEREKDLKSLEQFKRLTSPFIMRRMKTDKSIISDLPEKIVTEQYCSLTVEQKVLYESAVNNALAVLEKGDSDGGDFQKKRRGIILSMITALKQICNAPHCYDVSAPADCETSGKAGTLLELISSLRDAGRKTIIFTQYTATGELIASWLKDKMNIDADFLHGGVSLKERERMVSVFQSDRHRPVLILSLKAAGTGLNITAASAVIHYDLWWNPAVENQATDRAFRIGQKNNVNVYRFICEGTFEEKIDEMIRAKRELADLTVEAGEKWITELSTGEIRSLFKLSESINADNDED